LMLAEASFSTGVNALPICCCRVHISANSESVRSRAHSRGSSRGPTAQPFVRRAHVLSRNQRAQHRGANRELTVMTRPGSSTWRAGWGHFAVEPCDSTTINHRQALPVAKQCIR
jgi:hypothetical protein